MHGIQTQWPVQMHNACRHVVFPYKLKAGLYPSMILKHPTTDCHYCFPTKQRTRQFYLLYTPEQHLDLTLLKYVNGSKFICAKIDFSKVRNPTLQISCECTTFLHRLIIADTDTKQNLINLHARYMREYKIHGTTHCNPLRTNASTANFHHSRDALGHSQSNRCLAAKRLADSEQIG